MPIILPNALAAQIEKAHSADPWLWLWEIVLDDPDPPAAPTWVRLTPNPVDVVWSPPPRPGAPVQQPVTFYSLAMDHTPIEASGEGNLPESQLVIDNTGRFLMPTLEKVDVEGNRVSLWLVNEAQLATPGEYGEWDLELKSMTATRKAVTAQLASPNWFEWRSPNDRYSAHHCRYTEFGGPECGYVVNSAAAYTSCPRTIAGCTDRGDDEVARKLPRLHPNRGGFFPGVAVQR